MVDREIKFKTIVSVYRELPHSTHQVKYRVLIDIYKYNKKRNVVLSNWKTSA